VRARERSERERRVSEREEIEERRERGEGERTNHQGRNTINHINSHRREIQSSDRCTECTCVKERIDDGVEDGSEF
jgi:hypothetical protein